MCLPLTEIAWSVSASRLPGSVKNRSHAVFDGPGMRGVWVRLDLFSLSEEEEEEEARKQAPRVRFILEFLFLFQVHNNHR